uniref:Uncharacterized protein n=1 Tax=Panagrolaimus superbus TaxID=310955 RepID=A0A914Z1Q6_9BILA
MQMVTIHDKWIVPFPDAFGHSAPTGFMSSFGVRMKQFNRIAAPHGHCLDGGENSEDFIYKGFNYSVEGCHRSCTQREVVRVCGCADPMYPANKKIKTCSVSDPIARNCIKNTTEYLGRLIAEGTVPNCTCHQPCREIGYEVSYSAARWPSGTTKLMECDVTDDLCMEKYRKNAAMIQVFYEELNYETLTETPAYTMSSLLADLGGVTGLWIGASIVSLLELVVLGFYCCKAYKKNRKLSVEANAPYTIGVPPYKKTISISSSSTSRPPKKKTSSSRSVLSKHSILDELIHQQSSLPTLPSENEASDENEETPPRKYSSPYLPPGADLPCICLFDMTGRITKMKALCPEHGYMVRRGTGYSMGDDEGEEEEEAEGEIEGDWEY